MVGWEGGTVVMAVVSSGVGAQGVPAPLKVLLHLAGSFGAQVAEQEVDLLRRGSLVGLEPAELHDFIPGHM